ncbi:type VI secretion system protein TssA [Glaciecola sp. 33A]|jgi:type VI secretion system protein ImpA|uniref:type VI secretion system protein TssA n=1 Tax=Glaciecola sp. 33A TaxID=2057807 RepID=UPI000C3323C0|nr:type VI secretion system protein TssA [Glaciecola sp. 33A]PKI02975.1 type VI secretion system protein TssA [Glaciecola sp. 33A]
MDYDKKISSEVSNSEACGVNLEDDPGFQNFFFASQGTPERFDGQSTIPPEAPDWRTVKKQALEYLEKTRDLKLISVLAQAVLNTEGLVKFEQCLNGLAQQVKGHWQELLPPLDEDDGDPLERISALGHLCDKDFVINIIKKLPIAHSKGLGGVTLQVIDRAVGPAGSKIEGDLAIPQIIGIFKESDPEQIVATYTAVNQCIAHLNEINNTFIERAGNEYNVNCDATIDVLTHLGNSLQKYGNLHIEVITEAEEITESPTSQQPANGSTSSNTPNHPNFDSANMELTSRNDVERCFDLILAYYQQCEPSSPVPILINRAKKLVNSDFLDIVKDIFPDALEQVQKLGGITDQEPEANTTGSTGSSGSSW